MERTTLKQAIEASYGGECLTPDFVDWVWCIGIRYVADNPWLFRVDWEGVIQDVLIVYLDREQLPTDYDKPNQSIAKRLHLAFRHAYWKLRVDSGRANAWMMAGEKTTKEGNSHVGRRKKRQNKR